MIKLNELSEELLKDKYCIISNDEMVVKTGRAAFKDGVNEGYNALVEKIKQIIKETPNDMDLGEKIRFLKFY
jgi:hypothetical protein